MKSKGMKKKKRHGIKKQRHIISFAVNKGKINEYGANKSKIAPFLYIVKNKMNSFKYFLLSSDFCSLKVCWRIFTRLVHCLHTE